MKQITFLVLSYVFIACVSSPAQSADSALERGSVSLGGGLSFQSTEIENADNNLTTLIIVPNAMVYLFEGFAVGVELSLEHISAGEWPTNATHRYLGKFQYVVPRQSRIMPFFHGGFGYIRESKSYYDWFWSTQHESENGWTWELGLGLYTFLNEHFALKVRADYFRDYLKNIEGTTQASSNYMISIGFEGFIF